VKRLTVELIVDIVIGKPFNTPRFLNFTGTVPLAPFAVYQHIDTMQYSGSNPARGGGLRRSAHIHFSYHKIASIILLPD